MNPFAIEEWAIFFVAPQDMVFDPLAEELENLDGEGGPAFGKVGLELLYLLDKFLVFPLVCIAIWVTVHLEISFFRSEVCFCILDQFLDDIGEHLVAFLSEHCLLEGGKQLEDFPMLFVQPAYPYTIIQDSTCLPVKKKSQWWAYSLFHSSLMVVVDRYFDCLLQCAGGRP